MEGGGDAQCDCVGSGSFGSRHFAQLRKQGGIAPPERRRRQGSLRLKEREEISRGLAAGLSLRRLGRSLGRAASTSSREVARGGGAQAYRATAAETRAREAALRPKPCRLAILPVLRDHVAAKLARMWSPQQIAGWLKVTWPVEPEMQVSHETIYKSLFIQARGLLKAELLAHLRGRRIMRRSQSATPKGQGRGQIPQAVSIRARPAEIEDRAVPGHWEGDLLCGAANSDIATLVERRSRFVLLVKLDGKATETVVKALTATALTLPQGLMRPPYFCDPRTSATPAAPGSAAATKTPTACCASTSPKAKTSRSTARKTSTRSPEASTQDPDKPLASRHQPIYSPAPLRSPPETA